jgi:methylenetetrahydrofolate reductase (NADPH)
MAWKDEAFELWRQWGTLYEANTPSHNVLGKIEKSWYLINVVDNNFKNKDAIFDLLDSVKFDMDSMRETIDH